ncbi:hypothetical protein C3E98_017750 [Pseudomonas sp. MWU13-2625]|nr:hypothetical protein C3E98_017750 [Pseudomonas sp. MWU13-2625]
MLAVANNDSITLWERACSRRRLNIQYICRRSYRFREQARSHNGASAIAGQNPRKSPRLSQVGGFCVSAASY